MVFTLSVLSIPTPKKTTTPRIQRYPRAMMTTTATNMAPILLVMTLLTNPPVMRNRFPLGRKVSMGQVVMKIRPREKVTVSGTKAEETGKRSRS